MKGTEANSRVFFFKNRFSVIGLGLGLGFWLGLGLGLECFIKLSCALEQRKSDLEHLGI